MVLRKENTMKNIKRIIALLLTVVLVMSIAGCASAPQNQSETIKISDIKEEGIATLCKNLNKDELIPAEGTDMQNEVIGAIAGYRFTVTLDGGNALVELYEFDPENPNDTAKAVISDVKEQGYFQILSYKQSIYAELSDNEKYLMIYNDSMSTGDNPDAAHKERRDKITAIFEKAE